MVTLLVMPSMATLLRFVNDWTGPVSNISNSAKVTPREERARRVRV